MLGYGYPLASLEAGLARAPDFIGVDCGSTDPGPYYLGSGCGFVKDAQLKRDLAPALAAAVARRIPLIIGTAGGSGAKPHVDNLLAIIGEIVRERDLRLTVAVVYADLAVEDLCAAWSQGRMSPCGDAPPLTEAAIRGAVHRVGQMGTAPLVKALETGADVIVAGRCCDTAIFASVPILRGFDPALALHSAKIAECGALCARPAGANDALFVTLDEDGFCVEPLNPLRCCTPETVAAHSLYEQPDPHCFYEPEGKVDLSNCSFEAVSGRTVRVSGTTLQPPDRRTVKVEGAAREGFRALTLAGVRDPVAIRALDDLQNGVREAVAGNLEGILSREAYSLRFLRYGLDGVTGGSEPRPDPLPREVGLLIEAVAPTQELADTVISLARATALHQPFPGRKATAGNLAFPFSPSDFSGGAVYAFSIYHLMEIDDECALFPVQTVSLSGRRTPP